MKLLISETYDTMSRQAAGDLLHVLQSCNKPLICPASGSSPIGLYKHLVQLIEANGVDTAEWLFVGLDEWKGMNGSDKGSCRYYLDQQLFYPLGVKEENICFFNGRAIDLQGECERVEAFISKHGGIDVAIVGIGMNGHIGMNEPGTPALSRSHIADIHPITQQVGQKYFSQPQQLNNGVTLGMANILESAQVFLLANGVHKAEIIYRVLNEEVGEQLPATLLRDHQRLYVYLDKEAAHLLK